MLEIIKAQVYKFWPAIVIFAFVVVLFALNNKPGTYLIGWDNLQTDLDPLLNLRRSFFSIWEQYQGVGHLSGNAALADIPRQIFTFLISFVVDPTFLRKFYTFLMLFIGTLGSYFLIKQTLFEGRSKIIPLLGALFYMLNLSTVQTFYAPFEPHIAHFGFLPWLILTLINFLKNPNRRSLALLAIANILAIPQYQVPTFFFVYILISFLIFLPFYLLQKNKFVLKNGLTSLAVILIINSFWLIPFIYFFFSQSSVAFEAKINQMSTETVYLQNKAFGDLLSTVLIRGFWFDNVDPTLSGNFSYMLEPWRQHLQNIFVVLIGIILFAVSILGFIKSLKTKGKERLAFLGLFIFSFTMLATNTPPFSVFDDLIRKLGLINQVLRFPFTKFSIVYSLAFAGLFTLGLASISEFLKRYIRNDSIIKFALPAAVIAALILFMLPAFQGQFIYSKAQVKVPDEYFELFNYFKSKDPNTRIANFPQYTFWGWNYYQWGYGGSGFTWYGIPQPIMDRAFDVWSKSSENYYWEISNSLYKRDPDDFLKVLNKYQISWVLVDKNIFDPNATSSLFTPELSQLLGEIKEIKKDRSFGSIDIYEVDLADDPKSFVFATGSLNQANEYVWGNDDRAYKEIGNYITSSFPNYFYPFRTLFSNKTQNDIEFEVSLSDEFITLSKDIPPLKNTSVSLPSFFQNEAIAPVNITTEDSESGELVVNLTILTPEISIADEKGSNVIYSGNITEPIVEVSPNSSRLSLDLNGVKKFEINPADGPKKIGSGFVSLKENNLIVVSDESRDVLESRVISRESFNALLDSNNSIFIPDIEENSKLVLKIPTISDSFLSYEKLPSQKDTRSVIECDLFNKGNFSSSIASYENKEWLSLESLDSTACISFSMPNLSHNQGYAMFIESINITGRSLHTWLFNDDQKFSPIDTYLEKDGSVSAFIVPPQEEFGKSYSLHLDNISITDQPTINYLGKVSVLPIPYSFIEGIKLFSTESSLKDTGPVNKGITVAHPNEIYYDVQGASSGSTLILSQSFDKGWKAYEVNKDNIIQKIFPFVFAKPINNHLLINNWENGWQIPDSPAINSQSSIILVYLPVYFEILGFLLSLVLIPILIFRTENMKKILYKGKSTGKSV